MTLLWIVALTGWLLAVAALVFARGVSRRLAQLTDMYWQLKSDHGELKARVGALAGTDSPAAPVRPTQAFVPLGEVKRKP